MSIGILDNLSAHKTAAVNAGWLSDGLLSPQGMARISAAEGLILTPDLSSRWWLPHYVCGSVPELTAFAGRRRSQSWQVSAMDAGPRAFEESGYQLRMERKGQAHSKPGTQETGGHRTVNVRAVS